MMTSSTSDVVMNLKWDNEWKTWAQPLAPRNAQQPSLEWWQPLPLPSTVTPSGMSNWMRDVLQVQVYHACIMYVSCRVYQAHGVTPRFSLLSELWGFSRTLSAFSPLSPHLLEVGSQEGWLFAPTGLYQYLLSKCPKHIFEPIKTWERQVRSGDYVG